MRLSRAGYLFLVGGLVAMATSCEAIVGADFDPRALASSGGSANGGSAAGGGDQGGGGIGGTTQGGGGTGGAMLLPNGSACASPSECSSGHCVDEFCCDAACEGECQICDAIGSEGECTPLAALDPCSGGVCDGRAFCATGAHRFSGIAGGDADQEARGCAFGPGGDFWVAGNFDRFSGTTSFDLGGPVPLSITNLNRRVFVARFNAAGDVAFQTALGDDIPPSDEFNLSNMAVGSDGSVALVGTFDGEISACSPALSSSGPGDSVFVVKLDPSGACSWGKTYVGIDVCELDNGNCPWPLQVAVSPTGEVAVAGGFYGWIDVGDGERDGLVGDAQTFVSHHDADGNLVTAYVNSTQDAWAVPAGVGFAGDRVVVGGTFSSAGTPSGSISFGGVGIATNDQTDLFVAGLSQADVWEKGMGGGFKDWSEAMAVDIDGNGVMAASFIAELDFGLGPIWNSNPSPGAQLDLGVGKLSSVDGAGLWPAIGFGPMKVIVLSYIEERIAADGAANAVVAGRLRDEPVVFGGHSVPSQPDNNFLVKMNADGVVLWANAFGILDPPATEPWPFRVHRVAGGPRGEVGLCGFTSNRLDFGGGELTPTGGRDAVYAVFAN